MPLRRTALLGLSLLLCWPAVRSAEPVPAPSDNLADTPTRVMLHVVEFAGPGQGGTIDYLPPAIGVPGAPGAGVIAYLVVSAVARGINDSGRADALQFATEAKVVLDKVPLAETLEAAFAKRLDDAGLLRRPTFERVGDPSRLEQPGLLVHVQEPLILTLSTRHFFHPDLRTLHMLTTLRLWRKDGFVPVHQAELHYQSNEAADSGKAGHKHWLDGDGKLLREALAEAVEQTVVLVATDLGQRRTPVAAAEPRNGGWINLLNGNKETGPLYVVGTTPGRWLARPRASDSSLLISLPEPRRAP